MAASSMRPGIVQLLPRLDQGPTAAQVLAVARYAAEEGWRSFVASAGGPGERELEARGSRHLTLTLDSGNPLTVSASIARLGKAIREHRLELLHTHGRGAGWVAAFAAKRAGLPLVTTIETVRDGEEGALKKRLGAVLAQGARVVVGSDHLAEQVTEKLGIEPARLRVVRPGVDVDVFDPARVGGPRIAALGERWNLALDRPVVLVPGPVRKGRGQRVVLDALARTTRSDFVVLLVGDADRGDPYVRELEKRVREAGLGERVHFAGPCSDMAAAYALATLVVVPATSPEVGPEAAIEAQAMGRPVIVSNVGALGEAVLPASTGWLVAPDDAAELAWAIDLAVGMADDVRARVAERARSFAVKEFSAEQTARRTLAVYRELVRHAPRPLRSESSVERLALPESG